MKREDPAGEPVEQGGNGMVIKSICGIFYKEGQFYVVDMETQNAFALETHGGAALTAFNIMQEWAERHREEINNDRNNKADASEM